jgi:hypothetical protein
MYYNFVHTHTLRFSKLYVIALYLYLGLRTFRSKIEIAAIINTTLQLFEFTSKILVKVLPFFKCYVKVREVYDYLSGYLS